MAGPSAGGGFSGQTRKHGLGRFSLGRLFNISSFTSQHRSTTQHCSTAPDADKHSESSVGANASGKSHASTREQVRFPTSVVAAGGGPSSSNSESNSFCSGQVDMRDMLQEFVKDFIECPLCLFELPRLCFPELSSCNHRACYKCLQQYLKIEITESRINISCPECTEPIHPSDIRMILNDENLLSKYESFMLRRVLVTEPDARWCPAPDCGYAVIAHGCAGCPKLKCERPGCNTYFCYHCKQEWHPNQTCDAARAQRAHPRSSSVSFSQDSIIQTGDDIKPCPCCKVLIIKMDDGSCNHMTCSVCGTEFCWLCMKEISDLHYLSPSGCTFWGKKPWSRKKKIMWQLGMLVGAPVGIALIAGIAVPAIIIGIPVWVGKKLHAKYSRQTTSRYRSNIIVSSGVIASIVFSPILAGIAVGIGVPILLAYVYGVVPISLCRSGGCGVSTSPSGVRIEFDEENEIGMGNNPASGNFDGASVDTAVSQRGVNPSIGEVSLGMSTSLSLGSGSHLDRIGMTRDRESDRESASNVALAGSIASASLLAAAHKLEIQADVSSNKRFSLSSHSETASATVSLSERSANMSLADDASTKALAGSILGYRDNSAITPVEVHVDAHISSEEIRQGESWKETPLNNSVYEGSSELEVLKKLESVLTQPPHSNSSDGFLYASSRLKLWKNSKKRKHNSVQDDATADYYPNADNTSLKSDSYSFTGHVHFSELKEDSVSYIDESPCSEVILANNRLPLATEVVLIEDFDSDGGKTVKHLLEDPPVDARTSCVVEIPGNDDEGSENVESCINPHKGSVKCVSRSVSFCNNCTSTHHRPCCPDVFQRQGLHRKERSTKTNSRTSLGHCHSENTALVNRAYKTPCSLQDISISITAKDELGSGGKTARTASMDCVLHHESSKPCRRTHSHMAELDSGNSCVPSGPQPYNVHSKISEDVSKKVFGETPRGEDADVNSGSR